MDLHLGARRALVLCATGGIGRACASMLARECAEVTIVARNPEGLAETQLALAGETGGDIHTIAADVATRSGIATVLKELTSPPDIVVLLPPRHGPLPDVPGVADLEHQFLTEVLLPLELIEAVLPAMRAQGWGRIVHLTGAAVKRPSGKLLALTTLRVALLAYLRGMSEREAEYGVTINTVLIGYVDTPGLMRNWRGQAATARITFDDLVAQKMAESSIRRLGNPAEIASVVTLLASGHAGYVTGETVACDGGRDGFV